MTLTEAREILEVFKPRSKKVQEAIKAALPLLHDVPESPTAKQRLDEIREVIKANKDGFDPFATRSRTREIVSWRNCVYYKLRKEGYTYQSIARASNYDHSTVVVGCQKLCDYLETKDWISVNTWNELMTYTNQ